MRGDDERCARCERGGEPGGNQEVRVHDVRVEAARRAKGVAGEIEVAALPACAPVENGPLDVVPPPGERALDLCDERPEVGIVGPGIHLRDEQDPHRLSFAVRLESRRAVTD